MKNKLWWIQIPIILLLTTAFFISERGSEGLVTSEFIRKDIFPSLQTFSAFFTDLKFKIRGEEKPKNKIVIVEIDSPSIDVIGRWPWHRDATAYLIQKTIDAGAKVVGLDIVFSEPDKRIPDELVDILVQQNMGDLVNTFETDRQMETAIRLNTDKLVLGWTSESVCTPAYSSEEDCPVMHPDALATHPENFEKFAYDIMNSPGEFRTQKTYAASLPTILANIPSFNFQATHAGYFNAFPDPDGYIRRSALLLVANGKAYPSLPLAMARVGLNEKLKVDFDAQHRVKSLGFVRSGKEIEVNATGVSEVNFRGGAHTFTYVSALDIMSDEEIIKDELNRKIAGQKKTDVLKDAYVFIGVSALGAFDMRSFPFGSNTPGVEGHANILDNILSMDFMRSGSHGNGTLILLLLMTIGAVIFAYFTQRFDSIPALLLFLIVFASVGLVDTQILFTQQYNWNTGYFYIEIFSIFLFTMVAKYILEEKDKRFLKSAFTKYVAPSIVDSIIKDPSKLSLGGEKKELTIMFSDIRSFTTFSEKMEAKKLAAFLNDYLGIMTKLVFSNNGTLDKYIGDAVMAFWGAPVDLPKHASNSILATKQMMKAMAENRARWLKDFDVDVNIGIGVNTGAVNVGNMGSDTNFEYTVIGDHVNLASRLEGLTKAYGVSILTTRFTLDSIEKSGDPLPSHRVLDFVKVKGKKQAVELIQILENDEPQEKIILWEEARKLYSTQKWDEALAKLEEANKVWSTNPEKQDGPIAELIQRCQDFKLNPPGEHWDGSWEMHSK